MINAVSRMIKLTREPEERGGTYASGPFGALIVISIVDSLVGAISKGDHSMS